MADAAFATTAFPGMTTRQLRDRCAEIDDLNFPTETIIRTRSVMLAEIERRERVAAGDVSVMTAGERLRLVRKQEA